MTESRFNNRSCFSFFCTQTLNIHNAHTRSLTCMHVLWWQVVVIVVVDDDDADFHKLFLLQEPTSEKTNNGIHYKLQLLYSNGEFKCH